MSLVIISTKAKAVALSNTNLCPKCSRYLEIKYGLSSREVRMCGYADPPMRLEGPVSECNKFYDANSTSLFDMKSQAWLIETSKKKVGFAEQMETSVTKPRERSKEQKEEVNDLEG